MYIRGLYDQLVLQPWKLLEWQPYVRDPCLGIYRCLWVLWCGQRPGQEASAPRAHGALAGRHYHSLAQAYAAEEGGPALALARMPGPSPCPSLLGLIPSPIIFLALGQWQL